MRVDNFYKIEQRLQFLEKPIIIIPILIFFGAIIRIWYLPQDVPISLDGIDYFVYAIAIIQQGKFPEGILPTNNGWSTFLSFIFYFVNSQDIMDFMNLQRYASIIFSVLTVIPIYTLCRKFVDRVPSLIAVILFCFDPRIIQNSTLGLTEPLFIFLGTAALSSFLSTNNRIVYASFAVVAVFSLVRYEGLLLLFPFLIMFATRFKKNQRLILRYLLVIGIFAATITPMVVIRVETVGQDGLFNHVFAGGQFFSKAVVDGKPDLDDPVPGIDQNDRIARFMLTSFISFAKYFGWITIPIFVFFLPIGIVIAFKKHNKNFRFLLLISIFMSIPALYAYGRGIEETRYLYFMLPIFCVISGYCISAIMNKKNRSFYLILIITIIISLSVAFTEYKKTDYVYEREIFEATRIVVDIGNGVNDYEGNRYVKAASLFKSWPRLLELDEIKRTTFDLKKIPSQEFNKLEDYVADSENKDLTHLVVFKKNRSGFLDTVFEDENGYSYLIKEFDSKQFGYENHIKIFRIDYNQFRVQNTIQ